MGIFFEALSSSSRHIPGESYVFDHAHQGNGRRVEKSSKMARWVRLTVQVVPKVNLSSRITLVSSRLDFQIPTQTTRVGGYTKADATITYRPIPAWRWYAALENLTNASYEDFRGFPAPPLAFRLGIEYLYSPAS
jgi:outer membrane receptor protein involved in Fe transport